MLFQFDFDAILKRALKSGGEFADLFFEATDSLSITSENKKIENAISGVDTGVGIRMIHKHKVSYGYTNDLTEEGIYRLADDVSNAVQEGGNNCIINRLTRMDPPVKFKIEKKPSLYNTKEKVEFVKRAEDKAWSASDYIKQVRVTYSDSTRTILSVNSHGELCEDERLQTLFFVQVVAMKDGVIQAGYEPIGGIIGLELFSQTSPETVAEIASKRAVMMLTAGRINGGAMPVVLASSAGGTMIHEAIGHGLEADLAQQGLSVYSKRLGDMVASPLINVVDDSTMENKRGSFVFDDEGIPSQRTILVENGKLVSYMYDRLTAAKDKKSSTGNGRRQSYKHKPIPRMSNTLILPGTTPPDEIVQSIHKGLLVMKMGGGQVNTVNGDFVFEVAEGYIIENGKVCEPIKGATLTGNGPEILKNIDMVGNDLGFSIGTCGKDDQGVPVADGQPTLRIPSIVVGGKVE